MRRRNERQPRRPCNDSKHALMRMSECLHNYPFLPSNLDVRRDHWSNIYGDTRMNSQDDWPMEARRLLVKHSMLSVQAPYAECAGTTIRTIEALVIQRTHPASRELAQLGLRGRSLLFCGASPIRPLESRSYPSDKQNQDCRRSTDLASICPSPELKLSLFNFPHAQTIPDFAHTWPRKIGHGDCAFARLDADKDKDLSFDANRCTVAKLVGGGRLPEFCARDLLRRWRHGSFPGDLGQEPDGTTLEAVPLEGVSLAQAAGADVDRVDDFLIRTVVRGELGTAVRAMDLKRSFGSLLAAAES